MNNIICGGAHSYHGCNTLALWWRDPYSRQRVLEMESRMKYGGDNDPNKPPEPEPGDKYVVIGATAGLVVGGALGVLIGSHLTGFMGGLIGLFVGVIVGGLVGTQLGGLVKQRRRKSRPFEQ